MAQQIRRLKSRVAGGVSPAMATPLQASGYEVDTAVIPSLVTFLIEAGAAGLFVAGTTGEGILLDFEERQALFAATVDAVAGRVPLMLHVGDNRLDKTIALAQCAAETGADAMAVVTPYYYGINDHGLADYYLAIARAVPQIPLLLYDIPHMAVNGVSANLARVLSQRLPSLAGMKTSRRDAQEVRLLLDACNDDQIVLAGNERVALGLLALGCDGLISGLSTAVPEPYVALTAAFRAGDMDQARHWQRCINDMLDVMPAGARIGAVKSILAHRGLAVGPPMPPRPMPEKPVWPAMQVILERYGLNGRQETGLVLGQ